MSLIRTGADNPTLIPAGCGQSDPHFLLVGAEGVCLSCKAKRPAATAAQLVNHVTPHGPVRQIVLSAPKRLSPFFITGLGPREVRPEFHGPPAAHPLSHPVCHS